MSIKVLLDAIATVGDNLGCDAGIRKAAQEDHRVWSSTVVVLAFEARPHHQPYARKHIGCSVGSHTAIELADEKESHQ